MKKTSMVLMLILALSGCDLAKHVQEMSQKYFLTENAHIIVVGNQDDVAEKLGSFSANGKVNYYDVYGNKVEMNKNIVPDGLTAQTVLDYYIKAAG